MNYKYGIGVVSKNTVDVCIDFSNEYNLPIILIPSRRQVDFNGGYVNGWTTETLSHYIKQKPNKILLKRDHGGPKQGVDDDDGILSLYHDTLYFDAIHIDPWKAAKNFQEGCELTKKYIEYCYSNNSNVIYEVGTEQSIFKYESDELESLLMYLKKNLTTNQFNQIKFAVIQSGTSLKETKNTGFYNKQRLIKMVDVCRKYNLLSKEHNGDYLPVSLIKEKFDNGLDSINIAPEFGQLETQCYIKEVINTPLFEEFFNICYNSKKWVKWVDSSFNPILNKNRLINICGHYVLNYPEFILKVKNNIRHDIDKIIKSSITNKLAELYGIQ